MSFSDCVAMFELFPLSAILYLSCQIKTSAMLETFGGWRLTHLFKPSFGVTP